jgi:hypothetical protein
MSREVGVALSVVAIMWLFFGLLISQSTSEKSVMYDECISSEQHTKFECHSLVYGGY